uniref:Transglutaminase N-terminal domain-containing protein n=1 Tax=Accipiter nisus TaxID=211598 RepID=A0A8B9MPP4_9AVES
MAETWDLQRDRNGREHRTAEMGGQQLVVRRGQPFTITLCFSGRGYEEGVDKLAFNVETGECRRALRHQRAPACRRASCPLPQGSPRAHVAVPRRNAVPERVPSPPGRGRCYQQLLYQDREKR